MDLCSQWNISQSKCVFIYSTSSPLVLCPQVEMVLTYKNKFNARYGFPKDESHSIPEIAKLTGYKKSGLETIFEKGKGAFYSNRASIRPNVTTPEQWAMARIYASITPGSKASRIDASHLIKRI